MTNTPNPQANGLDEIELGKPFRINNKLPSGLLKDWTVFRTYKFHSSNIGIEIYFRDLERWVNPPTDTSQEYNIAKKIEKYGVEYLKNGEEL